MMECNREHIPSPDAFILEKLGKTKKVCHTDPLSLELGENVEEGNSMHGFLFGSG